MGRCGWEVYVDAWLREVERTGPPAAVVCARLRAGQTPAEAWRGVVTAETAYPDALELLGWVDAFEDPEDVAGGAARARHRGTGVWMRLIPGGGGVAPFLLAETPCTEAQWGGVGELPQVSIGWEQAEAWCRARRLRLPSEAEWEWACRAGATTRFAFGDDPRALPAYGWCRETTTERQRVGSLRANAWGLHDMHGGVWEWCQDPWDPANQSSPPVGWIPPVGPEEPRRAYRGGSFACAAEVCRAGYRNGTVEGVRSWDLGFRPAASLGP